MSCVEHDTCFYCGAPLAPRHEHDHFPIPDTAGGTETVPACMNCHELKDRTNIDKWPIGVLIEASRAFVDSLPPPGPARLLYAKIIAASWHASRQRIPET